MEIINNDGERIATVLIVDTNGDPVNFSGGGGGGGLTDAELRASPVPVSVSSSALPAGAATEATLAAQSAKLPNTLGQKTSANSLAVTIASDQSPLSTDVRSAGSAAAITPNDVTTFAATRGIWVGVSGVVVATINGVNITFVGAVAGSIIPIAATRVLATGTTASNLVALY